MHLEHAAAAVVTQQGASSRVDVNMSSSCMLAAAHAVPFVVLYEPMCTTNCCTICIARCCTVVLLDAVPFLLLDAVTPALSDVVKSVVRDVGPPALLVLFSVGWAAADLQLSAITSPLPRLDM